MRAGAAHAHEAAFSAQQVCDGAGGRDDKGETSGELQRKGVVYYFKYIKNTARRRCRPPARRAPTAVHHTRRAPMPLLLPRRAARAAARRTAAARRPAARRPAARRLVLLPSRSRRHAPLRSAPLPCLCRQYRRLQPARRAPRRAPCRCSCRRRRRCCRRCCRCRCRRGGRPVAPRRTAAAALSQRRPPLQRAVPLLPPRTAQAQCRGRGGCLSPLRARVLRHPSPPRAARRLAPLRPPQPQPTCHRRCAARRRRALQAKRAARPGRTAALAMLRAAPRNSAAPLPHLVCGAQCARTAAERCTAAVLVAAAVAVAVAAAAAAAPPSRGRHRGCRRRCSRCSRRRSRRRSCRSPPLTSPNTTHHPPIVGGPC